MNTRLFYFLGLDRCDCLIGRWFYLEATTGLTPVRSVSFQRMSLVAPLFFVMGFFACSKTPRPLLKSIFDMLASAGGIVFAGRQVFLQHAVTSTVANVA